jgi:PAS domain S-box-containing protein
VLDYTGLTLEESQGEAFRVRVFHPDDVESGRDERRQALARGAPFEWEQRALRHDGQYRWFIIRYKPLRHDQGRILRWYATGADIGYMHHTPHVTFAMRIAYQHADQLADCRGYEPPTTLSD